MKNFLLTISFAVLNILCEAVLEGIVIDNFFFGVSTVGKNGFESPIIFPNSIFRD